MKNYGKIEDPKDVTTKEYVDAIGANEWTLIEDITLEEAVKEVKFSKEKLQYKEVHIEALIKPTDTTIASMKVNICTNGFTTWMGNGNPKATGELLLIADLYVSPENNVLCDGSLSAYFHTLSGTSFTSGGYNFMKSKNFEYVGSITTNYIRLVAEADDGLGVGTKIKVWGR